MLDFLEPVWDQPRPSEVQIEEMWRQVEIPCSQNLSEPLLQLKNVAAERMAEGEIKVAECFLPENKTFHWFASRNRLAETGFFFHFFQLDSVKAALYATDTLTPIPLQQPQAPLEEDLNEAGDEAVASIKLENPIIFRDSLGFEFTDTFSAIGSLASTIYSGGPYFRPAPGDDQAAMTLALNVAASAFDQRFGEATTYVSYHSWAEWFKGIAWDSSWAFIDNRTRKITIILITDTD